MLFLLEIPPFIHRILRKIRNLTTFSKFETERFIYSPVYRDSDEVKSVEVDLVGRVKDVPPGGGISFLFLFIYNKNVIFFGI
jgi:hypothetical protein